VNTDPDGVTNRSVTPLRSILAPVLAAADSWGAPPLETAPARGANALTIVNALLALEIGRWLALIASRATKVGAFRVERQGLCRLPD
jgi:hypothetical protein